ncbi:hypothetical protein ACFQ6S_41830 [Streptomyces sp. NPDC056479]|uniref:hypothetical protein n=1 Tax=Streptomyces sp. NPDC056479 TaxID=3345832 RepID=UPI0036A93B24
MNDSASLAPEDMNSKRTALSNVSSSSQVTDFGFAATKSGDQRVADPMCSYTTLDPAGREDVGRCADELRSRDKAEGTYVDASDDNRTHRQPPLAARGTTEGGIWEKYWWTFVPGAVVIALLGTVAWVRMRRRRRDPYRLVLQLVAEDGTVLSEHSAGHGNNKQWYEFAIADALHSPRIERRAHGPYAVRRSREGGAVVRMDGSRIPLPTHGQIQLTDTLSLALGETPSPWPGERGRPAGGLPGPPGATAAYADFGDLGPTAAGHSPPGPSTGSDDDEWPEPTSEYP